MHIAIVEDAEDVAALLRVFLTSGQIHTVTTFLKDFKQLCSHPVWSSVDVIVCDRMLDDFRGEELLECLEEQHPNIRRIMLTGSSNITEEDAHAHRVLIKPVSPEVLLSVVESQ